MNDLTKLEDKELITQTKSIAAKERELTIQLLHYLREVERRMLFAEMGYGSLYEFCMKELGYSEGSAYRRIAAMRLLRDLRQEQSSLEQTKPTPGQPITKNQDLQQTASSVTTQIEQALLKGSLNLNHMTTVYGFLRKQQKSKGYTVEDKINLLNTIQGKSKLECEGILAELDPEAVKKEKMRIIDSLRTELKITLDHECMQKLNKIKTLIAHRYPKGSTYAEVIEFMAELTLKKIDPEQKLEKKVIKDESLKQQIAVSQETTPPPWRQNKLIKSVILEKPEATSSQEHKDSYQPLLQQSRYVSTAIKTALWKEAQGRCQYCDPKTGRQCESQHALQIEHIMPYALGGTTTPENLILLCRTHNALAAVQKLGASKMQKFLPGLRE